MNRSLVPKALLFFAAFLPGLAYANRVAPCNACSVEDAEAVAMSTAQARTQAVAVLDYTYGLAWQCDVRADRETGVPTARCLQASPQLASEFADLLVRIRALKDTVVELPLLPGESIYDIAGCPSCARQWLYRNRFALAGRLSTVDALLAAAGKLSITIGVKAVDVQKSFDGMVRFIIKVENDDSGGALGAAYCYAYLDGNEAMIDPNACVDSDGNPIPTLQNPTITNRYTFRSPINLRGMVGAIGAIRPIGGTVTVGSLIQCTTTRCDVKPDDE